MPHVEHSRPAYAQIADHYRNLIQTGDLAPGDQLPSISEIASDWDVARATAAKAIDRLRVEKAVDTSTRGTFVSSDDRITRTPGDRIRGPLPQRIAPGETVLLAGADIRIAPDYVAALLGVDPGSIVIRREEITSLRERPVMLSVDWIASAHVMVAADLLGDPVPEGPARLIASVTGRRVTHAQDHLESRHADAREAAALQIPVGRPILAGVHVWSDLDGVILYGEWVLPPKRVVTYTYEVAGEE